MSELKVKANTQKSQKPPAESVKDITVSTFRWLRKKASTMMASPPSPQPRNTKDSFDENTKLPSPSTLQPLLGKLPPPSPPLKQKSIKEHTYYNSRGDAGCGDDVDGVDEVHYGAHGRQEVGVNTSLLQRTASEGANKVGKIIPDNASFSRSCSTKTPSELQHMDRSNSIISLGSIHFMDGGGNRGKDTHKEREKEVVRWVATAQDSKGRRGSTDSILSAGNISRGSNELVLDDLPTVSPNDTDFGPILNALKLGTNMEVYKKGKCVETRKFFLNPEEFSMQWRSEAKGRPEDEYVPLEDIKEMQRGPASKDFTDVNNIVIDEDDERYDRCIVILYGKCFKLKMLSCVARNEQERDYWVRGILFLRHKNSYVPPMAVAHRWLCREWGHLTRNEFDAKMSIRKYKDFLQKSNMKIENKKAREVGA